jgi:probable F420-dependent oxidoreductase
MMGLRPFRFGVETLSYASSGPAWRDAARKIEGLGYATLLVDEHIDRQLAPIAALVAAAEATTALRVGSFVFANDFRHPALLAKEMASLDVLSGGRVELGLGTGYARADYDQAGIPFDPPGVRIDRLEEAIHILKGCFTGDPFSFTGRHYTVHALKGAPVPVQRPYPPLLIGGGARRTLSLAAREADIVSVNIRTTTAGGFDFASLTAAAVDQKVAWVRDAAGQRLPTLELNIQVPFVAVTAARQQAAEGFLRLFEQRFGMSAGTLGVEDVLASPSFLIGSVDQIVEELQARRERYGFSYIVIWDTSMDAFAPVVARLAGA